jgi:hypothetical protein
MVAAYTHKGPVYQRVSYVPNFLRIHIEDVGRPICEPLAAHTGQPINPMTSNHAGPTVHHVVTLAERKITSESAKKKKIILCNTNLSL